MYLMFCVEFRMCYHKIKVKSFPLHHSQPLITFPHTVFRSQSLKLYEELRARDVLWGGLFYRIQQNSFVVVFFLHRSLREANAGVGVEARVEGASV